MEIDDDDGRFDTDFLYKFVRLRERAVRRHAHERPPDQRYHADLHAVPRLEHAVSTARLAIKEVRRTQHVADAFDFIRKLFLIPHMVAGREDVNAAFIKLGEARFCETAATRHIFAVRDAEITAVLPHQLTDCRLDSLTPPLSDYVADEQYPHRFTLLPQPRGQTALQTSFPFSI